MFLRDRGKVMRETQRSITDLRCQIGGNVGDCMSEKIHFGVIVNDGSYESPEYCCDSIICGELSEKALESAVDDQRMVTCKKCLNKLGKISKLREQLK